jgi:ribosome biogenesis GTPase A
VIIDAIRDSEVVILINKIDLLPKTMKLNRIEERVRELGKGLGLNVKNVISISSLKDFQLDKVMDGIIYLKKHGDVCLVGLANTGKSSFLNAIINKYAGQKKDLITTSYIQGTTCDVIKIPLDESAYLIDTPGLISDKRYATYLSDASMKMITPKKYLKPNVFQLQAGQSVFAGGLFRIDLEEGENMSVTTFFANGLYIHRTKTENADSLYEKQVTLTLVPPTAEEQATIGPLVAKETLTLSEDRYDILVGGIGFIHLTGGKMKITTYSPEKIQISIVPSFL